LQLLVPQDGACPPDDARIHYLHLGHDAHLYLGRDDRRFHDHLDHRCHDAHVYLGRDDRRFLDEYVDHGSGFHHDHSWRLTAWRCC
jgi:hypothetical protein